MLSSVPAELGMRPAVTNARPLELQHPPAKQQACLIRSAVALLGSRIAPTAGCVSIAVAALARTQLAAARRWKRQRRRLSARRAEPEAEISVAELQAEAARLRAEAAGETATLATDRRLQRAQSILEVGANEAGRAGRECLGQWLQGSSGLDNFAADEVASELLLLLARSGNGGTTLVRGVSLEQLASEEFSAALEAVLADRKALEEKLRAEESAKDELRAEKRRWQEDFAASPYKAEDERLNDDRSFGSRALAVLVLAFPLFDNIPSGASLVDVVPALTVFFDAFRVPFGIFATLPLGSIVAWLILSIFANNRKNPRIVRYGLQLAVLLDVAFFAASFVGAFLYYAATGGIGDVAVEVGEVLYVGLFGIFVYCASCCASGEDPKGIPYLSNWTETTLDSDPLPGFGSD